MGKRYTVEERAQALKLAEEIGAAAAARRLGINVGHAVRLAWPCKRAGCGCRGRCGRTE